MDWAVYQIELTHPKPCEQYHPVVLTLTQGEALLVAEYLNWLNTGLFFVVGKRVYNGGR
jgi:hypothetical protein